jgi:hypothetical protein
MIKEMKEMLQRQIVITVGLALSLFLAACSRSSEQMTPEESTRAAWMALKDKPGEAMKIAQKSIDTYGKLAIQQEEALASTLPVGKVTGDQKKAIFANGALNEVGTCYLIKGEALKKQGHVNDARSAFQAAQRFPDARTWDPQGFFWSPAEAARKELTILH